MGPLWKASPRCRWTGNDVIVLLLAAVSARENKTSDGVGGESWRLLLPERTQERRTSVINGAGTLKGTGISQRRTVGETMATHLPLYPKTLEGQWRQRAHRRGRGGEDCHPLKRRRQQTSWDKIALVLDETSTLKTVGTLSGHTIKQTSKHVLDTRTCSDFGTLSDLVGGRRRVGTLQSGLRRMVPTRETLPQSAKRGRQGGAGGGKARAPSPY